MYLSVLPKRTPITKFSLERIPYVLNALRLSTVWIALTSSHWDRLEHQVEWFAWFWTESYRSRGWWGGSHSHQTLGGATCSWCSPWDVPWYPVPEWDAAGIHQGTWLTAHSKTGTSPWQGKTSIEIYLFLTLKTERKVTITQLILFENTQVT